jgi:hypothetical protein
LYVNSDLNIQNQHIKFLGVRQPDDEKLQLGYGDFPIENYVQFMADNAGNKFIKEIKSGRGQRMLELRHPDFDVLGYVVDAKDHM